MIARQSSMPFYLMPGSQHSQTRGRPIVEQKCGKPVNMASFDPRVKLHFRRATPGLTNRMIEDRWPREVFPMNNISNYEAIPNTMPAEHSTSTPERRVSRDVKVRKDLNMAYMLAAACILGLYLSSTK